MGRAVSMLTSQVKKLRTMAAHFVFEDGYDYYDKRDISWALCDAADTIEGLRNRLTELPLVQKERETCRMELLPDEPATSIQPMRCTACGHKTYAQLASYCPHCGRSVAEWT